MNNIIDIFPWGWNAKRTVLFFKSTFIIVNYTSTDTVMSNRYTRYELLFACSHSCAFHLVWQWYRLVQTCSLVTSWQSFPLTQWLARNRYKVQKCRTTADPFELHHLSYLLLFILQLLFACGHPLWRSFVLFRFPFSYVPVPGTKFVV